MRSYNHILHWSCESWQRSPLLLAAGSKYVEKFFQPAESQRHALMSAALNIHNNEIHYKQHAFDFFECVGWLARMASISTCEGMLRRPPKLRDRCRLSWHIDASSEDTHYVVKIECGIDWFQCVCIVSCFFYLRTGVPGLARCLGGDAWRRAAEY